MARPMPFFLTSPFGGSGTRMGEQSVTGYALEQKYAALLKAADATIRSLTSTIDIGEISRHNYGYQRYRGKPIPAVGQNVSDIFVLLT